MSDGEWNSYNIKNTKVRNMVVLHRSLMLLYQMSNIKVRCIIFLNYYSIV